MAQVRTECTVCLEVFNSAKSFDKHRTGTYRPKNRRCLTVDEMVANGFTKNPKGWWGTGLGNSSEEGHVGEEVSLPDEVAQEDLLRVPNQLELDLEKGVERALGDEALEEKNKENTPVTILGYSFR